MGDITKADTLYEKLGSVETEQEIRDVFAQLRVLKEALKAADKFREQSVRYAQYEAYALIRAVEISGGTSMIRGKYRKLTAEWLVSLSESERNYYIAKCSDGKTIDNVYKSQVFRPEQRNALANAVKDCKNQARDCLRNDGVVNVPMIVRSHSNRFPKSMLREITDGVRDAVRSAGGVGIGGNTGIYIDPDKNNDGISDAIATRIEAVARDIEGIADLASRSESKPVFRIKGNCDSVSFVDVTYMILAGIGCAKVSFSSPSARKNSIAILRQIAGDV